MWIPFLRPSTSIAETVEKLNGILDEAEFRVEETSGVSHVSEAQLISDHGSDDRQGLQVPNLQIEPEGRLISADICNVTYICVYAPSEYAAIEDS